MNMSFRIKRSFFYFKLNVIVEIRLLAKFDYCAILEVSRGPVLDPETHRLQVRYRTPRHSSEECLRGPVVHFNVPYVLVFRQIR